MASLRIAPKPIPILIQQFDPHLPKGNLVLSFSVRHAGGDWHGAIADGPAAESDPVPHHGDRHQPDRRRVLVVILAYAVAGDALAGSKLELCSLPARATCLSGCAN
jgi:hypothetical protein